MIKYMVIAICIVVAAFIMMLGWNNYKLRSALLYNKRALERAQQKNKDASDRLYKAVTRCEGMSTELAKVRIALRDSENNCKRLWDSNKTLTDILKTMDVNENGQIPIIDGVFNPSTGKNRIYSERSLLLI